MLSSNVTFFASWGKDTLQQLINIYIQVAFNRKPLESAVHFPLLFVFIMIREQVCIILNLYHESPKSLHKNLSMLRYKRFAYLLLYCCYL